MDYNDRLWEKKLAEQAKQELGAEVDHLNQGSSFSVGLGSDGDLRNVGRVSVTREDLLKGIDDCKGTPPEQLKNMMIEKIESMFINVENTLGWPKVVQRYQNFDIVLEVRGHNDINVEELDLSIDLDDVTPPTFNGLNLSNYDGAY